MTVSVDGNASKPHLIVIYSLRGGGAERALLNVLHRLGPEASKLALVIARGGGVLEHEVPACVDVTYLFKNEFLARACFWLFRKRILRAPLEIVWKWKIRGQYVSAVSFLDSFITDLVVDLNSADRKVAVVHSNCETNPNYDFNKLSQRRRRLLLDRRYSRLDALAFVSNSARGAFSRVLGELDNFETLPILFSAEEIREKAARESGLGSAAAGDSKNFRFVCIGSLLPVKGHALLIDACALLAQSNSRFHLDLVGDGPLRSNLEKQVKGFGLSEHVTFHGFLSNPYPLLARSDAMILPSVSEAMPTVVCEAHALGVPVLASDCDGCRDILEDGEFGLIFRRERNELAASMKALMDLPALVGELREKGKSWLERYNEAEVLERYRSLIGLSSMGNETEAGIEGKVQR